MPALSPDHHASVGGAGCPNTLVCEGRPKARWDNALYLLIGSSQSEIFFICMIPGYSAELKGSASAGRLLGRGKQMLNSPTKVLMFPRLVSAVQCVHLFFLRRPFPLHLPLGAR